MSHAMHLRVQAERCFRLALGPASPRLANELEELGRALEQEAIEIEAHMVRRSATQNVTEHYVYAEEMAEAV
jgi:hypothetical protein